jgi:hypothetical protein
VCGLIGLILSKLDRPVIITGIPRSRTSLVAGIFKICGLYMGDICGPTKYNVKGQFEYPTLIKCIEKEYLIRLGYCPLGQKLPLPPNDIRIDKDRKNKLLKLFNIGENVIYGWKDCKSCLTFNSWNYAFPNAIWIIVTRNPDSIINSCLNTNFMRTYNSYKDWKKWLDQYLIKLDYVKSNAKNWYEINTDELINHNFADIEYIIKKLNLNWNYDLVNDFLDPTISKY